jgi:hypothetical protein
MQDTTLVHMHNGPDRFYKTDIGKIRVTTGDEKACIIKEQGEKIDVDLPDHPWGLRHALHCA